MLVIIADDLTGALDTAAPFAARGLHTEVALTVEAVASGVAKAPEVLSINLASREKMPQEAFRAASRVIEGLPSGARLFKKIDSRLKGHVAVELDAISYRHALVAPAIPAFGRVVRDGHVQGFGVVEPISVAGALRHHASRARIADTESDRDLQQALAGAEAEGIDLLVGARGLAEALALDMTGRCDADLVAPPRGNSLFVIGSHDRITLEQLDHLRALDNVCALAAPNGVLASAVPEGASLVLVQATPGDEVMSPDDVAQNLASSVHPELTTRAKTLLLCGGATAEAVLARMGVECFRLQGECLPGLGLAYAGGQCIIAKSGGFGQPDTLVHLAKALHKGMD